MTKHGEVYYEGREITVKMKKTKPGELTDDLRIALGMPIGPQAHKCPAPWLIAQQRFGPPPSYPGLKIPGLNCPIPEGCSFGYGVGGWGKPPVDENGKPLYGDVFGIGQDYVNQIHPVGDNNAAQEKLFGEFMSSEDESEEDDDASVANFSRVSEGLLTPSSTGITTPSGTLSSTSIISNLEVSKIAPSLSTSEPQLAYQVLPEKQISVGKKDLVGTSHIYDVSNIQSAAAAVQSAETIPDPNGLPLSKSADGDHKLSTKKKHDSKKSNVEKKKAKLDDDEEELLKMDKKFKF